MMMLPAGELKLCGLRRGGRHPGHHGRVRADLGGPGLGDALADHLAQGVDVVGVHGHDVAVGVGVEIFNRKGLHLAEHVVADVPQGPLPDVDQDSGLGEGRHDAQGVEACHFDDGSLQRPEVRILPADQRQDVGIDQRPHEHGSLQAGS